jgi:menaquinone reductase, multiheme cytochrome c subunit
MDLKPLFVFPRWSNTVTLCVLIFLTVFPLYGAALVGYALDPVTLNVNYQPVQPVPYSHALHVGKMGIDCRYCHNTVENAGFAAIPPTETCMNCHRSILPKSEKLAPIRESFATGKPPKAADGTYGWRQVTTLPDYVYFNHAAHVNSGISCVECHGQINNMETVYQAKPMNMAWCLQCHRDPTDRIRPRDQVTKLDWKPSAEDASTVAAFASLPNEELAKRVAAHAQGASVALEAPEKWNSEKKTQVARDYVQTLTDTESLSAVKTELGQILKDQYHINPNTDCVTCHR